MRRGVGISSLERHTAAAASYDSLSSSLSSAHLAQLHSQLTLFQQSLRAFASKHGASIRSHPAFRSAFSAMCAELGVDPLGGGKKGLWDYVGVGQWTYELAVQVVDVCLRSRERNGGLVDMDELLKGVLALRAGPATATSPHRSTAAESDVTEADIARAIKALEPLESGYSIVTVGSRKMVRSVPSELDTDSLAVISAASAVGYTTHSGLRQQKKWTVERTKNALEKAVMRDGLVWVDEQGDGLADRYYVPALYSFEV